MIHGFQFFIKGTDEKIEAIDAKAKGLRNEFTQTSVELCKYTNDG